MGFKDWFFMSNQSADKTILLDACTLELKVETLYKRLAIDSCVNLIANAVIKSRFRTFEKGKIKKANMHYLFNVKPNRNQNASDFIRTWVSNLLYENEALIVQIGDELYIADEWDKKEFALKENIYNKVIVKNFTLDRSFNESEVFYFNLNNQNILDVIDGLYSSYGKLLAASIKSYKRKNSKKSFMRLDGAISQQDDDVDELTAMFSEQFKKFYNSDGDALWPLQKGLELQDADNGSTAKEKIDSRDIRAIIDDVFDFVAIAFRIPKGLLKGDVADVEAMTDNFLTFCVNPIAELIADEINAKMYSKKEYLEGTRLVVDTRLIKAADIATLANAADKLLNSGTHSPDENRDMFGLEPIGELWSEAYYITKNYETAEQSARGGEN